MARSTAVQDGVEVIIETGVGFVSKLEHDGSKRNAHVEITAVEPKLQYPLKGWIDTHNAELWTYAQQAQQAGTRLAYRLETHRRENVAANVSIADLETSQKVKRLVSLAPSDGQPVPLNGSTSPSTAQAPQAPPRADDGDPGPTEDYYEAEQQTSYESRPRIQEGKPWERLNSDGSVNLGSYAITASVGMVELAYERLCARRSEKGIEGTPTRSQVGALARMLLDAADQTQAAVRADGRVDRIDGSHTRARGAVRSVVEAQGIPWDQIAQPEGRPAWVTFLAEQATMLLSLAVETDR